MGNVNKLSKKGKKPGVRNIVRERGTISNQWQSDQRQQDALTYYMDPDEKETWGNAYKALEKAGYSSTYARRLASQNTLTDWFLQAVNIQRINPIHLQQKLQKIINSDCEKTADQLTEIKMLGGEMGMFQTNIKVTDTSAMEQAMNAVIDM